MDSDLPKDSNAKTLVRIYSPAGQYWKADFLSKESVFCCTDDLVFSACITETEDHGGDYYSEFDHPTLEELKLIAALMLAAGPGDGTLNFYPLAHCFKTSSANLTDPQALIALKEEILEKFKLEEFKSCWDGPPPTCFGGATYSFYHTEPQSTLQREIYENIDLKDHLLMRGLQAFLKAGMLSVQGTILREAANWALYIALDASFSAIKYRMQEQGIKGDVTSAAVAAYMETALGEPLSGENYFSDYYDDRIRNFHPLSRFGVNPYPPLLHGDFFHLYLGLREVYRWLILGKHISLD